MQLSDNKNTGEKIFDNSKHKETLLKEIMYHKFGISQDLIQLAAEIENDLNFQAKEKQIQQTTRYNQLKVLDAFRKAGITEYHLRETTGYGYGDAGREALDEIYANIFETETAIIRLQMVSGTHALTTALFGNLQAGEELICATGPPYDTLATIIGKGENPATGSLIDSGVLYQEAPLTSDGYPDHEKLGEMINSNTKMVLIQRSIGYTWRPALTISEIKKIINTVKTANSKIIVLVDNCYGEFVEELEPGAVGADLIAGSLIKNPGGGLAPCGGYIAGCEEYVQAASRRLIAPGIESGVGPTLGINRWFYHGLFLAPHIVGETLRGALFASHLFQKLGYEVLPQPQDKRGDIIQSIKLNNPKLLEKFCKAIQHCSPIDSNALPIFGYLPGYDYKIIMAAGTFVQGASLELTADAPLRTPYIVFLQGGLMYDHAQIAALSAAQALRDT